MSEIAVWYDPVRFKYYLEKGNVVEEVHPITRQYIEDLTTENAKLQEQKNAKLREQNERLFDKTLELSTENDKLRELVDVLYPSAYYAMSLKELSKARDLMHELGIKVDA